MFSKGPQESVEKPSLLGLDEGPLSSSIPSLLLVHNVAFMEIHGCVIPIARFQTSTTLGSNPIMITYANLVMRITNVLALGSLGKKNSSNDKIPT
jgi:hypothetical protein